MRLRAFVILVVAMAFAMVCANKAEAGFIDLTNYPALAQPTSSGQAILEAWLSSAVTDYNFANNLDLPAPGLEVFRNVDNSVDSSPGQNFPAFKKKVNSLDIPVAGYQYLVLNWGGPDAPCGGNQSCVDPGYQAIWIGDPGAATFYTADNSRDGHGLLAYGLYNAVPDGGTTLALLGGALMGLGALRRGLRL